MAPTPDSNVAALRAVFQQDSDALDRAMTRMQQDGSVEDTYPRLFAAAMVVLLRRRLGTSTTMPDIVALVARLRATHRTTDTLDVHPLTTERLIRASYGDAEAISGLDPHELADTQSFLVSTLAEDEALDHDAIEELLVTIRERADREE